MHLFFFVGCSFHFLSLTSTCCSRRGLQGSPAHQMERLADVAFKAIVQHLEIENFHDWGLCSLARVCFPRSQRRFLFFGLFGCWFVLPPWYAPISDITGPPLPPPSERRVK